MHHIPPLRIPSSPLYLQIIGLTSDLSLASCIKSACSIGDPAVDISSAVGLYNSYCSSRGLFPATAAVTTTSTPIGNSGTKETETVPSSSSPASSAPASESGTSSPTSSASNVSRLSQSTARLSSSSQSSTSPAGENSGESKGGGLSTSDKITLGAGLGVGLLTVFIAVPGCIIAIKSLRRKRAMENPP
ncbi:hypothetical protein BKA61DRAFT_651195 [Leptodontidium sp. MPI-SDFR-AT-0119]|nr:hypothetical protein BKA61DRAFT_651195 [Leptodontidium sp. MPI-SDFR-AT-0119]